MLPILLGAAALGGATFAGFHAMLPKSQLYGRTFFGTPGNGNILALTYDDGPNDACTPRLLDLLAEHNVKATFFLIGRFVRQSPELARRIVADGHAVGNHTVNHPNLAVCSAATIRRELFDCSKLLEDTLGTRVSTFRPPFGGRRPAALTIGRELGLTPIMWSVTCYDWKRTTADRVEAHALRQIRGGDVVLFHDGGYKAMNADRLHTLEATRRLLVRYKLTHSFSTIPEWLAELKNS